MGSRDGACRGDGGTDEVGLVVTLAHALPPLEHLVRARARAGARARAKARVRDRVEIRVRLRLRLRVRVRVRVSAAHRLPVPARGSLGLLVR